MLLISNGRMLDPASGADAPRDILLAALEAVGHSEGNYRLLDTGAPA